ncbi:hypothetical protein NDU88_006607 [Pleurodeles waltl]|uniref:Uncharacterized protein n=1 Tax=Pleurodeles waltl TaxID=8319 RepID=A0AAV7SQ38_PLEWA|nr:hypothetical protein NDU88_006607 [Pleurodeles waltl]
MMLRGTLERGAMGIGTMKAKPPFVRKGEACFHLERVPSSKADSRAREAARGPSTQWHSENGTGCTRERPRDALPAARAHLHPGASRSQAQFIAFRNREPAESQPPGSF